MKGEPPLDLQLWCRYVWAWPKATGAYPPAFYCRYGLGVSRGGFWANTVWTMVCSKGSIILQSDHVCYWACSWPNACLLQWRGDWEQNLRDLFQQQRLKVRSLPGQGCPVAAGTGAWGSEIIPSCVIPERSTNPDVWGPAELTSLSNGEVDKNVNL